MKTLPFLLAALLVVVLSAPRVGAATLFQLKASTAVEAVDEASSFSLTLDGITATLTANVGVLNTTASGFGVNHPLSGDPTDLIDGVNAGEAVSVTFNVPVALDQLVLSLFTPSGGEVALLTIDGAPGLTLLPMTAATDVYNFTTNNTVPVGETVTIAWVAGNGFSFDSFTVTAVPEPGTLWLLAIGVSAMVPVSLRERSAGRPRDP